MVALKLANSSSLAVGLYGAEDSVGKAPPLKNWLIKVSGFLPITKEITKKAPTINSPTLEKRILNNGPYNMGLNPPNPCPDPP